MIEVISAELCTSCDLCVDICPTYVFDRVPGGIPAIARQEDCQTCFMCEANCPVDAMYVSPLRAPAPEGSAYRSEIALRDAAALGTYRAQLGWGRGRRPPRSMDEAVALARPFYANENQGERA